VNSADAEGLPHRLVTLTGVGGTGKTRLALQVAAEVLESFPHGVWLVELAPIADPDLVPQAVASVLTVREQQGLMPLDALTDHLRFYSYPQPIRVSNQLFCGCNQLR
jgi:predicted ATPase